MRDTAPDRRRAPPSEVAGAELSVIAFPVPVRLLDISLSGKLLESTHQVEVGTRSTLRFNFGGEPFWADVKVERLTPQAPASGRAVIERFEDQ